MKKLLQSIKGKLGAFGKWAFGWGSDFTASYVADEISETTNLFRETPEGRSRGAAVAFGRALHPKKVDRVFVMRELGFVESERHGSAIKEMLAKCTRGRNRGQIWHRGIRRSENSVFEFLECVAKPEGGRRELVNLDEDLENNPDTFWASYEAWNDDRYAQPVRHLLSMLKPLRRKTNRLFRELNNGPLTELRIATATWRGAGRPTEAHRAFEALRETVRALAGQNFRHIGEALVSAIDIAEQMWNSANVWTMLAFRVMVGVGVLTPLILYFFASIGTPEATGVIATWFLYGTFIVLPLLWLLAFFNDPWIIGVALVIPTVREALKKLATVVLIGIALEFMWGFFLATVPLELGTRTLSLVLLAVIPVICFALAGKKRLAGWTAVSAALVITVLAVGGWGAAFAKTKVVAGNAAELFTGTITLGPGNGCISIPDDTREIVVMVPPGAWTMGVPRPQGATCFWARPQNGIEVAMYYGDGTCKWIPDFQSYMGIPNQRAQKVTEMRFRNSSNSEAVRVRIQFKG